MMSGGPARGGAGRAPCRRRQIGTGASIRHRPLGPAGKDSRDLCCRQATDVGFPHAWWQPGHRVSSDAFPAEMRNVQNFPVAVRRGYSASKSDYMHVKFLRLTSIVQYLFKTKPFMVLRRTRKKREFFRVLNVLFLHISAIVFY
jgi:hypothetical protein